MSPRRKKAEKKSSKKKSNNSLKDRIQNLNITKSYTSLAYGIVTVVVLFILIVVGIRTFTSQDNAEVSDEGAVTQVVGEQYTVKEGQTLWEISEEVYGTGFEWQRIADANNLEDPSQIEKGMNLTIPELEDDSLAEASPSPSQVEEAERPTSVPTVTEHETEEGSEHQASIDGHGSIEGEKYTVAEGDYLWDMAVRAYGDGYRWVDIYHANMDKIINPDLIYPGQEFTIPQGE